MITRKKTTDVLTVAAVAMVVLAGTAIAAPALIDFGRPDNTTSGGADTYNNISFGGSLDTGVIPLADTSGTATGWSIQLVGEGSPHR